MSSVAVFIAPGSIGTLRVMTGSSPVPLAGIAEDSFHPESFLNLGFEFMPFGFHFPNAMIHIFHIA